MKFDLEQFNDKETPKSLHAINEISSQIGFDLQPDNKTGALLQLLVSSKPDGIFLELGTGTGITTSWMLNGMSHKASLITIDRDESTQKIAKHSIGLDSRITFKCCDALEFLKEQKKASYDLIFADALPGKWEYMEETISLLKPGGLYVVDDMLPFDDWPDYQYPKALENIETLKSIKNINTVGLHWSTGLVIVSPKY